MPEMGLGDVQQKLEDSILMYKKRPVLFVKAAANLKTCRIYDLLEQEEKVVDFDENDFTPPIPRIGMVNLGGGAVYVKRIAIRRYKLGLSRENLNVQLLEGAVYPENIAHVAGTIRSLKTKELAMSLLRKYPTLKQAFTKVKQFDCTVAFDKQFAVTSNGLLLYKNSIVGKHNFERLVFNKGFEHLKQLVK